MTFEHGAARRFDLVVGADGLHSIVRRLTFGDESRFRRYIGGYLAVYTVPNDLQLHGRMLTYLAPGKLAATYPVRQTGQARAAFLFRRPSEFDYDHRDLDRQRRLLREVFAGEGWEGAPPARRPGPRRRLLLRLDQPDRHASTGPTGGSPWSATPATPPARPSVAAPASP